MKDLENLLKILLNHNIDFVVIGGLAAILHGSSVVTQDIDICTPLSAENIDKIRNCLREYHPFHRMTSPKLSFMKIPEKGKSLKNLYLETDIGTLDMLTEVTGLGNFKEVQKHAIEVEIFDQKCKVLSIDALLEAKQRMGRDKDKAVIKELNVIREKITKI